LDAEGIVTSPRSDNPSGDSNCWHLGDVPDRGAKWYL
jgi:hypothetical protein